MKGGQVLGERCKGDGMVHRIDTSDPGWWRSLAACRDVVPPHDDEALPGMGGEAMTEAELAQWRVGLFFPTDIRRIGPRTLEMRQAAVDAVRAGRSEAVVAAENGVSVRVLNYWMTLANRQLVEPVRKTTQRSGITTALATCGRCPVRNECLEYALDNGETDGVWGGMDPEERRIEVRRRNARRAS